MDITTANISITETQESKLATFSEADLKFGRDFTDHMLVAEYADGEWGQAKIVPFQPIQMNPATSVLHYAQSIFEGLKAFRGADNEVVVFRPEENFKRMQKSAERMCMPPITKEIFLDGMLALLNLDRNWIPGGDLSSLYIRPFQFASDEFLGVQPAETYKFMIVLSPSGAYYGKSLSLKVETHYTRATQGGTGAAKAAGNYAGSLYPAKLAKEAGYDQLLWTDSQEHKYIEEAGTMNVMLVKNGVAITPALTDSILPGVNRKSVVAVLKDWGIEVIERRISVDEIEEGLQDGSISEVFGIGTAATIAKVESIGIGHTKYQLSDSNPIASKLYSYLDQYKRGQIEDKFDWNTVLK